MNTEMSIKEPRYESTFHPHKFALWASLCSITMMFIGLISAYIVRYAAGNWQEFNIPSLFYISTVVLVASSFTLHKSYKSFVAENESAYKFFLLISLVLGIAFVAMQTFGWFALEGRGIELNGNPSGSFFYLISGLHALHILGGIAAMVVATFHAYKLPFFVSNKRRLRFDLVVSYWHFVDILWIILIVFIHVIRYIL